MKCIILAGGSGDSLWPLSRKNYPKQFMKFKEGRSLLQETVVRNMPYCDEFIIVTNEGYKNIVNGQMKVFQSLKYRVILEGAARGTAAAIMLGTLFANQSEYVLVVNSDNFIDGDGYKDAIIGAKEMAKTGAIVTVGIKPKNQAKNLGYILRDGNDVKRFISKVDFDNMSEVDSSYSYGEGYLWNSGILVFRAGDMINTVKRIEPVLYSACKTAKRKVPAIRRAIRFPESVMRDIPHGSIEKIILEHCYRIMVMEADVTWKDIDNVCDIEPSQSEGRLEYVIKNDCSNVSVINNAQRQLVVANDLRDVVVVNTEDAVYVSSMRSADGIKEIIRDNMDRYEAFFDYNRISYRPWGIHELLNYSQGYKVKKVTVFPGMAMNLHQHELRAEYWSVVEGVATITLGSETKDYHKYESVFVPVGAKHKVANKTDKNVVIIEVGIGDNILESDLVKIYNSDSATSESNYVRTDNSPIVKLDPAFKDNLWGGTKIRDVYGKKCDFDVIGESWELSAHPDGQSRIAAGNYKGMLFNDYLTIIGKGSLGWKCQALDRFPILIKFIDAKQALSIQIHPDDEYALENENEFGKNEMWYVLDAEPGAFLYCGLSRDASKEEIEQRIENNTITEILNKIEVKRGDVVMVKAGTIHAIGAGIFICEIQQNSNCTYRMYDYDRRDKFGNPRELHVGKSLDVVVPTKYVKDSKSEVVISHNEHFTAKRLVQCKYFEVVKYDIEDEAKIPVDESSFVSVVFFDGTGTIFTDDYEDEMEFKGGESFFISAGKRNVIIKGKTTCVVTHV
ncbi:MAG: sugar phosphate nucleotidyltransferase [Eubacteriales bacterium]|nr:sugar phosphate nucleotidyltransferase [Eubacteriales bacterium]